MQAKQFLTTEKFSRNNQDEICVTSLAMLLLFWGQRKMQRAMKHSTVPRSVWLSFLLPTFIIACFGSHLMNFESKRPVRVRK